MAVGSSRLVTGLAALLGLAVVGGALVWWLGGRGDETATSAELVGALATDSETDAGTEPESDSGDGSTTGDAAEDGSSPAGDGAATDEGSVDEERDAAMADDAGLPSDRPASIDVAMTDPVGRSAATGTAGLRLDPSAGEVCYDIRLDGVATPADGHIHLGPAGVKGGIVVDFGPMDNGVTGCLPVSGTEVEAILADLDGHYVELHDPIDDFTIRAQLSEGTGPDGQPIVTADATSADQSDPGEPVLFDPDGGGAIAIVEAGRIILRGEVADREVAERVLVDFAGLSEIIVVDELTMTAGAPLPSGRVIIDSPATGLFASDSDVLDPGVGPLVDQLVALMEARADWQITVVGHTDSTGNEVSNLELSLRRAEAVRQELIDGGIAAERIRVRGAGSTDPLADNATIAGRAENRRIEFEIAR